MKVVLLGPPRPALEQAFASTGDTCARTEEKLDAADELLRDADFLVSYGYRHIISGDVLELFGERAVNLHISLLPFNRGADPNLWSYLEDTPKGVTIHVLDTGLDTGPVIAQREVEDTPVDTLKTTYERLTSEIERLFGEVWPSVRTGAVRPVPQKGEGTEHRSTDKKRYSGLLVAGWDTPVAALRGRALRSPNSPT